MKLVLVKNDIDFKKWLEIACHSRFPVNENLENIYIEPEFEEEMSINFNYTKTLDDNFKIKFGHAILLALVNKDNEIVGTVCVRKDNHKYGACHINNIAIHPTYRKQGLGRLLIEKTCELVSKHSDFKYITLTTDSAREFYKHIGMKLAGVLNFGIKKRYYFFKEI